MTAERSLLHRLFRFQILALLFLGYLLLSPLAQASVSPVKSPNDPNEYRYLELDNGLRVVLASDPAADKAAASMNVAVGSGNDPKDREGLAHFLERSEEHTSELQSRPHLVCRLLLEKKK